MRRRLRTLAASTALGLGALVLPVVAAAPAAAATAHHAPVEGEAMRTLAGRAALFSDAAASGRRARVLLTNGTASTALRAPVVANRLMLRVRGDQAGGAPRAVVVVDGRRAGELAVANSTWRELSVPGRWTAGAHVVQVRFVNDGRTARGDRNLRVDRLRFATVTAPAPTAPAPTAPALTAPAPAAGAPSSALDDAYEARVVQLVNAARTGAGLRALAVSPCADRYAEGWATHLSGIRTLVHRAGLGAVLEACSARAVGENIAYGGVSAEQLVQMWLDSPGHRANILAPAYTHVGTGAVRTADGTVWAAQNFLALG